MDDGLVRFGILGCAYIARKMSRAIMQAQGVCLYAIGSRSLEKAQAFAKDNGFPSDTKVYGSYQSVLDDEAVDAVYIPLPTSLHVDWVLKASAKKKHVLLEKPPALSTEDLDKIISACELEGVQLMDCTMWTHHPRTVKMKEVLKSHDLLGDILEVHASFFVPMKAYDPNFFTENIRINPELDALGALGDLGWYCARAILWAYDYNLPASIVVLPGAQLTEGGVITRYIGSARFCDSIQGEICIFQGSKVAQEAWIHCGRLFQERHSRILLEGEAVKSTWSSPWMVSSDSLNMLIMRQPEV
ncbi:hypothetical protein GOP47_0019881 [Adiantum capillus-veneris]|uniref:Gfo/Idh/MocA-like oxidoreductase N-terminal domain-containing protein n=1 Tax=Adiantum capillus-veneris TaxID=13818 RepID=A0A9D4ZA22_ADICA|nr:hypothetical protein GOP47_0019881 [Adiantum capillus-veneris]